MIDFIQRIKIQIKEMYQNNLDICSSYMKDNNGRILKYPTNMKSIFFRFL